MSRKYIDSEGYEFTRITYSVSALLKYMFNKYGEKKGRLLAIKVYGSQQLGFGVQSQFTKQYGKLLLARMHEEEVRATSQVQQDWDDLHLSSIPF